MIRKLLFILSSIVILSSCLHDEKQDDYVPDIKIKVWRYDKLQQEFVTTNSFTALQKMNMNYPKTTKMLIEDVLTLGTVDDIHINDKLQEYYSDPTLLSLMNDATSKFKDMSEIEEKFSVGFKELREHIPGIVVPQFVSLVSALNQSVIIGDSLVAFSIDKYMGQDYSLYKKYYYDFQSFTMTPERIVPDCFFYYLLSLYPFPQENNQRTLQDVILHHGKIHWIVYQILKYNTLEEELGYRQEDIDWCNTHKKELWQWILQKGHLKSSNSLLIKGYINRSPFISIMDQDTPPMIGLWLGIHLIDLYMSQNKDVTYQQLLEATNYDEIMNHIKIEN